MLLLHCRSIEVIALQAIGRLQLVHQEYLYLIDQCKQANTNDALSNAHLKRSGSGLHR